MRDQAEWPWGILQLATLCLSQNVGPLRIRNVRYVDTATHSRTNGIQESPQRRTWALTVILVRPLALPISRRIPFKRSWGHSAGSSSRQNARTATFFFCTSANLKWHKNQNQ